MTTPVTQTAPETVGKGLTKTKGMTKSDFELLLEKDIKTSVWIQPYGAGDGEEIKLSVPLIRRYVAVPAWDKENQQEIDPSDEECVKFLMLCNARRLNPFEGDAYMIPFFDTSTRRHRWSLITAHSAFLKRAELHPHYDGMESGIIVQRGNDIVELAGDFRLDTDKLLGGWSKVHRRDQQYPNVKRVKLSTYVKSFGVWTKDPEGMICKVAEAQGMRDSFPTLIGGMYLREEMAGEDFQRLVNQDEVKKPALVQEPKPDLKKRDAKGRPTLVEEPLDEPAPEKTLGEDSGGENRPTQEKRIAAASTTPEEKAGTTNQPAISPSPASPPAAPPGGQPPETELLALCKAHNISDEQLRRYLFADRWLKPPKTKLQEMSSGNIGQLTNHFKGNPPEFAKRILSKQ